MLASFQIADSLFNAGTTTLVQFDLSRIQQFFQRCTADASFLTFSDRHNQHTGVSLLTQVSGNCQVTVILQVPSISFPQRQSPRDARFCFPLEHLTLDDSSMMFPNSTCFTLAIIIAFSRYPSTASCVVAATGSDFTTILRLVNADGAPGNIVLSPVPISNRSPMWLLALRL